MASCKALQSIQALLTSTQGATGEMLADGLPHALKSRPEERHELQAGLLKMVSQVLNATRGDAQNEAQITCKQNVDSAQTQLDNCKATATAAKQTVEQARAASVAQKKALEDSLTQRGLEEEEHQRVQAHDEEKSKEVAYLEESREEVVQLLTKMEQPGNTEEILTYLRTTSAESPLVAALRTVLEKEATQRVGFDTVSMDHLQAFLKHKIADWDSRIQEMAVLKANIHAEALGAWAVKEVATQQVKDAELAFGAAEIAVLEAEKKLKESVKAESQQENVLNHYLTDLTLAQDRVRQCTEALEALAGLEKGAAAEAEVPAAMVTGMEVDADAKLDSMMEVDSVPVTA